MPVFEYQCRECGAVTEVAEHLDSGRIAARVCRGCGGRSLEKIVSHFVYNPEVTLEDLGIKVDRPMRQGPPPPGFENGIPTGPPPGGCPYENMEREKAEKEKKDKENTKFIL